MQILITHDGRPILQNVTVDEALAFVHGYGGAGATAGGKAAPVPVAWIHHGRSTRRGLRRVGVLFREPTTVEKATATAEPLPVPGTPALPGMGTDAASEPTGRRPTVHGEGTHPAGPQGLAGIVQRVLCAIGGNKPARRLAKRLGISASQVQRLTRGNRGTSPKVLVALAGVSEELKIPVSPEVWLDIQMETRARSRHLPKAWRATA